MTKAVWIILFLVLTFSLVIAQKETAGKQKSRSVYIDKKGVIRWDNGEELALFGANYSLPSACDYRAAKRVTQDLKKLVDDDMAHFARMGWDGMRLCLWGDYENSDKYGNLIVNDHLDVMDYAISKARERGIYILLTPITTYGSQWPDAMGDTSAGKGFSTFYKKSELGTNPEAIKVQVNYLTQVMNHVNPYTQTAIKDEPNILLIEMINEPDHHSKDFEGSVKYINALVDAIKSTGCTKLLFHNYTQDINMDKAIGASKVDGSTFAWYPMGLVSGHRLTDNNLRTVDDFTPMHTPYLAAKPRIVYEFDEADSYTPYMYPAMTRAYRAVGAQFVAMFSYDMLATAPYNLGWQTHLMNPVYYPQKGVAAIISSEMMKQLPLYKEYGAYPENTVFGPVRISYEENLSELNTNEKFMYANNTATKPLNTKTLKQILGYGSSPVVSYTGKGIYYLDKVKDGTWRLEVYPDALLVNDPFEPMSPQKIVSRLAYRNQTMTIDLPEIGKTFEVFAVNAGNTYTTQTTDGKFIVKPGVYVLTSDKVLNKDLLPAKLGYLNFNEFVCPQPENLPVNVNITSTNEYISGQPVNITAQVTDEQKPVEVDLYYRNVKYSKWFIKIPMQTTDGYTYEAQIPADKLKEGFYKYCIVVKTGNNAITFPSAQNILPWDWDFHTTSQWQFTYVDATSSLALLKPEIDFEFLYFTRIGDGGRQGIYDVIPAADGARTAIRLYFPVKVDKDHNDYTMSLSVKNRILSRKENMKTAKGIDLRIRGNLMGQNLFITLMEADGTSWTMQTVASKEWNNTFIPFEKLQIGKGVMLPQGFPGQWNYWVAPAKGRGGATDKINPEKIERVQLSIRPSGTELPTENPWLEVSEINVIF